MYQMTPARRVALHNAQQISARKRRKHAAMTYGYAKLSSKSGLRYKRAASRLMTKIKKNSKGMYNDM
jgi:hypothetical protein